jgi:tripeptide aminopeptidase
VAIEARSIDERRVEAVVADIVDRLQDGAAVTECDVDVDVQKLFTGYRTKPAEPAVRAAEAALQSRGFTPGHIHTGGGSDANALMKNGFPCCVNLANGTRANHQPDESVSAQALEAGLDVTLALLDESAAVAV